MNDDACMDICQNDDTFEDKLACICHELELALKWKRPSFLFAIYDTDTFRQFAQDSLEAIIEQTDQKVVHYQVDSESQIELFQFINDITENKSDVFFIRSSNAVENNTQTSNLISMLNSCRGFLVDNLVRVVFWLTENEALKVAHLAPDFWASRHRVFEFFNSQATGSLPSINRGNFNEKAAESKSISTALSLSDVDLQVESPLVIDFSEEDEPTFSGINLLLMLGVANWKEGHQEKAIEPLQAALALAQKSENKSHQVLCHKAIALVHSESGRTSEAIKAYEQVIDIGSENITIWNNLGQLYLKVNKYDEALKAFKNAIKLNPNDPISWNGLGNIYSGIGDLDEAINCYRKAIQFNAGYISPWIQLADVLAKQARFDDALYAYMRIVEMDKKNVHAWSEIGSIYFKARSFEQSIGAYKKALILGDSSPDIHKNLAYAHTQAGDYGEATSHLLKAIEMENDENEKASLSNVLGDVYRRIGDYDSAVAAYEAADSYTSKISDSDKALSTQSTKLNFVFPENEEEFQENRSVVSSVSSDENQGMPVMAEPESIKHILPNSQPLESLGTKQISLDASGNVQANKENANLLFRLANIYSKVGEVDKAVETFGKAVILDPLNGKIHLQLGNLFLQKNDLPRAISFYKTSADLFPNEIDKANAFNMAGDLYRQLKDFSNALGAYESAIGFDPKNETIITNLGKIQEDLDQLIEGGAVEKNDQTVSGKPLLEKSPVNGVGDVFAKPISSGNVGVVDPSIKIDLSNPDVWNELGNIYAKSKAFEEAVEAYQKAIALNPEFGWSYSNLALVYAFQGKHDEAINLLEKSVGLQWTDKDKAVVWNRLGDLLRKVGQYPRAIAAYQNADKFTQDKISISNLDEINIELLFSHFIS